MASQPQKAAPITFRPKRTLSIRARLMILALIAIVPIVLERIHNEQFDRGERIEAAHKQALGLARRAATLQNDVIVSTRALLQALTGTRAIPFADGASCNELLKSIAEPQRWIRALSVATPDGRIVCSSSPVAPGLDIGKRAHFLAAVTSGKFVLSDYFMGTRDKTPFIVAAMPQRDAAGKIESVVLATLDLNWIGQIAGTLAVRSRLGHAAGRRRGHGARARTRSCALAGPQARGEPAARRDDRAPEGIVTDASLDGVRRIYAFTELPGTRAHVAVGLDQSEVLARVNSAMWTAFAELGAVTFLVLLSIWFGAERLLVRPIRLLAETAGRIGRGEDKTHAAALPWALNSFRSRSRSTT